MVIDTDNPNWIIEETFFKRMLIKIGIIEVTERKTKELPQIPLTNI
tara:strand:- start:574 stop:711 length:138 start_codon:yes stop_codon:yes gene_type:complete